MSNYNKPETRWREKGYKSLNEFYRDQAIRDAMISPFTPHGSGIGQRASYENQRRWNREHGYSENDLDAYWRHHGLDGPLRNRRR